MPTGISSEMFATSKKINTCEQGDVLGGFFAALEVVSASDGWNCCSWTCNLLGCHSCFCLVVPPCLCGRARLFFSLCLSDTKLLKPPKPSHGLAKKKCSASEPSWLLCAGERGHGREGCDPGSPRLTSGRVCKPSPRLQKRSAPGILQSELSEIVVHIGDGRAFYF